MLTPTTLSVVPQPDSSSTHDDSGSGATLAQSIRAAAEAAPDNLALVSPGESEAPVTYADLLALTAAAHAALAAHDLTPERPVAVLAEKSPQTIATVLAAMERDLPVLLLSPLFPELTREEVLSGAGVTHVVHGLEVSTREAGPATAPGCALLLTTSGSGGTPKVVRLPADGIARFAAWARDAFDLGPGRPTISLAPLNFDLSLLDVWASLACGGTAVLVAEAASLRGAHVLDLIRRHRVHLAQGVPMFFHQMVTATAEPSAAHMRHVILTGDRVTQDVLDGVLARFPAADVHNVYGATETNDSFCHTVDRTAWPSVPLPIGEPLPGVTALVLDDDGVALTGPGVGELVVRTPYQAVGYTDEVESRRKFVRLGANPKDDTVYYRSGDRVRRAADGTYHYLGRGDRKVKVRGVLVDLDEIEMAIGGHADVLGVAVVAAEDPAAGHRVHAVVSVDAPVAGLGIALRLRCLETLHRVAVPNQIHIVEGPLPRTTTGKIDRRRALADVTSPERQTA